MGNIQALLAKVDELIENEATISGMTYDFVRDEKSNLYILFENDEIYTFPSVPFRPYQLEVQRQLFVEGIRFHFLVWPRRAGKEHCSWNIVLQAAITDPGLYLMIYPTNVRARMVLWEGAILLPGGQSIKFLDMLPQKFLGKKPNDADMVVKLTNGSVIWILGSDIDPDKLRGTNPRGVVLSEFAYSDPRVRHILMPILRQNGGWMIGQTTYNGMNHAYQLMQDVKSNPSWYCRVETIETLVDDNGNRYVTDDMIEEDRKSGMPEFMIQQEYYSAVELNQETLYFATELNIIHETKRIIEGLVLPHKRVRMHMDLGLNDSTACVLEQSDEHFNPVVIAYYENNNKEYEHYFRWAENFCRRLGLSLDEIFAPHDGKKRDFGTAKDITDYGRDFGLTVHLVKRPTKKYNAIQAIRRMLYRCRFNKENTARLIDCLSNYCKEFDEKRGIYKDNPLHNFASHGCFTGDTEVLTLNGHCSIMNLPKTGKVLTSCGWKNYINPRVTRKNAKIIKVIFKNNYMVKCTPDHLFKTVNGWISAEKLVKGLKIQSALIKKNNVSLVKYIDYIKMKDILLILRKRKDYIGWFGKQLLEKSQEIVIFITSIIINLITPYQICNAYRSKNIYHFHGMNQKTEELINLQKKITKKQQHGIVLTRGDNGIKKMLLKPRDGKIGKKKKNIAWYVISKLMPLFEKMVMLLIPKNIAHGNADLEVERLEEIAESEDVWCLTVPGMSEFSLANGAIVHNCDAFQTMTLAYDANMINERSYDIVYINQNIVP